ncbi:poly(3-hydroxyalkanoic acid) depolymerase [Actinomycetospora sp. NBRC 106375]|uniref:alpha/beta fold hydrolase n=1 Tax=Actinomycetospora sp. NBRC 106375 TaxID=3032207 RepID=UPI0024A5CC33|nr:alpha/beta hydrolase [Actinomycetospora sp. NBRC 106375]GLZ46491.1 poly(3-hydroxyalkanoic acid) depolymerase [Actinomycetospora sp. NBRC 106375]
MSALAAVPDPAPGPAPEVVTDLVVHGYRVHVAHRPGAPGRRPLVLVNGIGASLEFLDPLVDVLDQDRPVVRFDVPGIGGSPVPWAPLPMAGLAALLAGLLDQLGYARADVLGLSWGGGIAQQFALQHPDRTGRLALVSTGTGAMMVPARLSVLAKMLTPRRYNDRGYRHDAGAEIYVGEDQEAVDAVFDRARRVSARGYVYQLTALLTWTSLPVLPFISAPTLVLAGRRDPVIPVVNARIMGALLPRATVHLHAGGHVGILTRPRELGPVVEDFLDS